MRMFLNKGLIALAAFATIVPYSKFVLNLSVLNVLVAIAVFVFIVDRRRWKIINEHVVYVACAVLFAFIIDLASPEHDVGRSILYSLGLFLFFLLLFSQPFSLQRFARCYVFFFCVSSLIAIFQSNGYDWAWEARNFFGVPTDAVVLDQFLNREKASGLAYNAIQFSYQALVATVFVYTIFSRERFLTLIFLGVILLGILSTGSLSLVFLFLIMAACAYWPVVKRYVVLFLPAIWIFAIESPVLARAVNLFEDSGFTSRLSLLKIGVAMISNLPLFGYSLPEIERLKSVLAQEYEASDWVASISFHNSWLTTLLENGWLMLVAYLYVFFITFKLSVRLSHSIANVNRLNCHCKISHLSYRLLPIGLLAYFLKTSFHNAGIQTGDVYGWMLIAFVISSYEHKKEEIPLSRADAKVNVK